jgi:hypothetical protein
MLKKSKTLGKYSVKNKTKSKNIVSKIKNDNFVVYEGLRLNREVMHLNRFSKTEEIHIFIKIIYIIKDIFFKKYKHHKNH